MMEESQQRTLLRRYEPIIRFTRGEEFFPMDAKAYIRACSLWIKRAGEQPQELVPANLLTPETLAKPYADDFGAVRYLKFTDPLSAAEMAVQVLRQRREGEQGATEFRAGKGRLARVGYTSRVVDALFRVALLARGRVPGDAAAAASMGYRTLMQHGHRHVYHGRVVEENGWVVLQYWYFYLYNNWRSRFSGANDHEADWEMVCIYLAPDNVGLLRPEWVAYASHDHAGDDLRRHWSDPEVQKIGDHPVIYAGAGSHAAYFSPGEYLTEIELNALAPVTRTARRIQRLWKRIMRETEGQGESADPDYTHKPALAIPFVDYARGDGLSIGPEQDEPWGEPPLIHEGIGWVRTYRGLWGLYTQDPFAGEDAPAGPMFNRDGTVRRSWYDPVGWAGLDKVPPATVMVDVARKRRQQIVDQRTLLRDQVNEKLAILRGLHLQATSIRSQPHLRALFVQTNTEIETLSSEIDAMQAEITAVDALLESLDRHKDHLLRGGARPLRDHIRRAHTPATPDQTHAGQVAELWAAISVTVLLVAFVLLFYFNPRFLPIWLVSILALFAFIEAGVRGAFTRGVSSFATALAIVAALVLLYEFFWWVVGAVILTLAIYILWDNLRELTRSWQR
jgi:hypothetical protein